MWDCVPLATVATDARGDQRVLCDIACAANIGPLLSFIYIPRGKVYMTSVLLGYKVRILNIIGNPSCAFFWNLRFLYPTEMRKPEKIELLKFVAFSDWWKDYNYHLLNQTLLLNFCGKIRNKYTLLQKNDILLISTLPTSERIFKTDNIRKNM